MAAIADSNPLEIVLGDKNTLRIIISQHGVYLGDKMAGSN